MIKLLFVAIDAMGAENANRIGAELNLPAGKLQSLPGDMNISGPAWTSIYTGVLPEKHGVTTAWGHRSDTSKDYGQLEYPCIWDYLNAGGYTCGLYGIPMTFPVRQAKDWAVAGFCRTRPCPASALYYGVDEFVSELEGVEMDVIEALHRGGGGTAVGAWMTVKDGYDDAQRLITCDSVFDKRFNKVLPGILAAKPVDFLFVSIEVFDRIGHLGYSTRGLAVEHVKKWVSTLIQKINPEDVICVADHGFSDTARTHDYKGGVISTIGLPQSVMGVKKFILRRYFGEDAAKLNPAIAPLNNEKAEPDTEKTRAALESLGYM